MSAALDQKLRRELKEAALGREPGRKADSFLERMDMEALEEGKDLHPEAAQRLQNRVGNQALANVLNRNNAAPQGADLSVEMEEEEGQEQEAEEDVKESEDEGVEAEETQRQFGGSGGGGGGGGGAGANPWEMDEMFGGDDDEGGGKPTRRRRMRPSAIRNFPGLGAQDLLPPKPKNALEDDDLDAIERALGPLPAAATARWGDALYQAVEPALLDPRRLGRRTSLEPEDLVDSTGVLDPLGRPAEMGRFLADACDGLLSRSLARVLGGPSAALLAPATGHAGAAARLASLAVCVEALEGGGLATDRAVAVALRRDAWPAAMEAASGVDAASRLRAPHLLTRLLGADPADEPPVDEAALETAPIGGRALEAVIPSGQRPAIPHVNLSEVPFVAEQDEEVAAVDAVLARLTGGADPADIPPDPTLSIQNVSPVLEAATGLINALSRAQVELAAAALAVRKVHPRAPVRRVLARADEALLTMARSVMSAGRRLEKLVGQPMNAAREQAAAQVEQLREAATALAALRVWAFSALGGAVAV